MVRIRIRRVVRYDDGCFCVVALLLVSSLVCFAFSKFRGGSGGR